MNAFREREIRNAARDALQATGYFDDIYANRSVESETAEETSVAQIEPMDGGMGDEWDSQNSGGIYVDSRMRISVLARHQDQQIRDERAELLLNLVCNTLNGSNLGGIVCPGWSKVESWKWHDADPPTREISAVFAFRYLVDSWTGFNTSD